MARCAGFAAALSREFRRAVAYGAYEGALRDLIHLFKYNGIKPAGKVLARLLARRSSNISLPDSLIVLIPVPLWSGKRQARGFNQAEAIARAFLSFQGLGQHPIRYLLLWSAHGRLPRRPGLHATSAVPTFAGLLPWLGRKEFADRSILLWTTS